MLFFRSGLIALLLVSATPALAQTSDANQQLEQARQRLIEQGEQIAPLPPPPPSPTRVQPASDVHDRYRLGPGDAIFASVLRFSDLSFQATIDLEGNIIVPLAGSLSLRGLTIAEAQARIQAALNRFVVNPVVAVTLVAQRPVSVSIVGEIVRPGQYPLAAPELTIALLSAGGTTELADLRSIRIRRTQPNGTVIERNVDLFTPLATASTLPDVRLEDNDVVVIPALSIESSATYDRNLVARSNLGQTQMVIRVLNYAAGSGRSTGAVISRITLPNGSSFLDAVTTIAPNPDAANLREVALVRFDPQLGRPISQELDARAALRGDFSQNPTLANNDVIIVGRNFISRFSTVINSITQPFRDVLGFLLFFDTLDDSADNLLR
ncbi:polysaccharide export protein [Microcoleus sp. FACHB-1515]|uniref:polysaccharide biosynthesis/export family protein n=1 Tax=Cyanophyceae TaxID=3028117 RepID=UPI00168898E5|nr:polysaccharide biosynthesis/export family protein [Microcoleus sp. FACHB-1515]MBD2090435.1 polysaccharide export protein [Microcoleus sp. FACHB-1515]